MGVRISETKWHLGASPMARHREYYKGEGGGFPQVWAMVSLVSPSFVRGSSVHQKCFNYTLTNLLLSLCRSMWIIDVLVIHPNCHPGAISCPSILKVLRARERTLTFYLFIVFTFGFAIESIKEFGGASLVPLFCRIILPWLYLKLPKVPNLFPLLAPFLYILTLLSFVYREFF